MSRLGLLYAISNDELSKLKSQETEDMYDYMLENIEEELLPSAYAYELDKAWEGIQWCLTGGEWSEEDIAPANIIFGGNMILDYDDCIITLKDQASVKAIAKYLREQNLQEVIRTNFDKIDGQNYSLPKDEDNLNYLLGWSEGLLEFYENALRENLNVIFTVDL